ncbi:hypothetical protein TSTA_048760 [Talaromyces stipitatus ATCC 10500]|uniref:Amidase domain-containing protein n=1 Tax=Talaromyces stipitatus (strain ATCC 10500 / CBS 375.48 / QM 6759 / NRRL 1006) TaxID=441959 RepID=B8ML20_TALSN|nr:uncharacterized protein TSTA_048760 [Talaromyces stipitatus ATCC 10500]EED15436.1 hypothetical protein TSTA_048760 [Talaromyces stipitatus ATCC 10500]
MEGVHRWSSYYDYNIQAHERRSGNLVKSPTEYHGTKSANAPAIETLQMIGAVIVGKTKLNAMLVREETMECV